MTKKHQANIDNYFLNTLGTFKFIGEIEKDEVGHYERVKGFNYWRSWPQYKQRAFIAKFLGLTEEQAKEWKHNFSSQSSWYWFNKRTNQLIRISNHWSRSNGQSVNRCGFIRSCYWGLHINKEDLKLNKFVSNFQFGIIKLNKLVILTSETAVDLIYDYNRKQEDKYSKMQQKWYSVIRW